MMERMWSKGNTPPLLMKMQTCAATLEIGMAISWKIGNQSILRPSYTTSGHIPEVCSIVPQIHLLNYVHSTFIHNNQNLEIA